MRVSLSVWGWRLEFEELKSGQTYHHCVTLPTFSFVRVLLYLSHSHMKTK